MRACSSLGVATLAGVCGLAGCSLASSRPSEVAGDSGSRSIGPQQRAERVKVHIGDTTGMVTVAMGQPDEKREVADTKGDITVWVYRTHQKSKGQESTGWSEVLVPAVVDQNGTVVHEAVTHEIYLPQGEMEIHVTFAAGVVSSVQQQKH